MQLFTTVEMSRLGHPPTMLILWRPPTFPSAKRSCTIALAPFHSFTLAIEDTRSTRLATLGGSCQPSCQAGQILSSRTLLIASTIEWTVVNKEKHRESVLVVCHVVNRVHRQRSWPSLFTRSGLTWAMVVVCQLAINRLSSHGNTTTHQRAKQAISVPFTLPNTRY